jgi:hypothetical protein
MRPVERREERDERSLFVALAGSVRDGFLRFVG